MHIIITCLIIIDRLLVDAIHNLKEEKGGSTEEGERAEIHIGEKRKGEVELVIFFFSGTCKFLYFN